MSNDKPERSQTEHDLMRRAEAAAGMRLCFYQPRRASAASEGWLCESADDNGQAYATRNIEPTREACARAVIEEFGAKLTESEREEMWGNITAQLDAETLRDLEAPTETPEQGAGTCATCRHYWHRKARCVAMDNDETGERKYWTEPSVRPPWCPGFEADLTHKENDDAD